MFTRCRSVGRTWVLAWAASALLVACGGGSTDTQDAPLELAPRSVVPQADDGRSSATAASVGQGQLSGSVSDAPTAVNLTAVGTGDWAHWGDGGVPGLVRKSGGGSQIGAYTASSAPTAFSNSSRSMSWSDGTPSASAQNNTNGLWQLARYGYTVTVPAGTTARTVTLYVGGWLSTATMTAHLSDGSALDYVDAAPTYNGPYVRTYTLTYRAASANQTLTLGWVGRAGTGHVDLYAVALSALPATNHAPVIVSPGAQTSQLGQALTLPVSASDPDGDPLTYGASGLPTGLAINAATGVISGTPSAAGTFTATVTASDGKGTASATSFGWTIQPGTQVGSLSATVNATTASANLSLIGSGDWAHWGDGVPGLVRKSGGGNQIGALSVLGGGTPVSFVNSPRALSWSDGVPTLAGNSNTNGLYLGTGGGYSITVPAGTTQRTVTLYVGGWQSGATVTAHLSDGSAPDYTQTVPLSMAPYVRAYAINYRAGSANQTLTLTWQRSAGTGHVDLNAIALSAGPVAANQPPVITAPAAQTSTVGQPVSLAVKGSDPNGDALSFSAANLPNGLAINASSGVISGTPSAAGSFAPTVTVSDGKGGAAAATFAWTVQPAVVVPVAGLDGRPSNTTCVAPPRPQTGGGLKLARVFPNLNFNLPVGMFQPTHDTSRWYVIEQQTGLVRVFPNNPAAVASDIKTFLNLGGRIQTDSEMGLLGLAFAPNWPATPQAYVYYSVAGTSPVENRVSRFTSNDGGATLDPSSEQIVLRLVKNQSDHNHNGGNIVFGPDGLLYIGTGDGGGGGDPNNNSQNRNVLFGKMLRIDVDNTGSGYNIPGTNPFAGNAKCVNGTGGAPCPEIFAYGLRNPWRYSFDRANGHLWAGDVGQANREEIDVVTRGGNFGWHLREGSQCYANCATTGASGEPLIGPLAEYDHSVGSAITGGYVYRGTLIPELIGRYVFGDYVSSRIFTFQPPSVLTSSTPVVFTTTDAVLTAPQNITSFAQGNDGELYVIGYEGALYQLQPATAAVDTIPTLLSQTGCVAAGNATQPASGLIPYGVNAPFWSDNADKQRWLAVPNGASITPQTPGRWTPPNGTVLVKNFRLNNQLVETRLLMRHPDGVWAGYTYEWNAAQTDATRVIGGKTKSVGTQTWIYPSENDCLQCHTQVAGRTLGLETAQLNGNWTYAQTGRTANQILTLNTIGLLSPTIAGTLSSLPALVDPHGGAGTLDQRARAFLHANCSQCHQPNGPTPVALDLRYSTPLAQTGACNATATSGDLGLPNAKIIAPGAPDSSVLLARVNRRDNLGMPPLGSSVVDTQSVAMLRQWIQALANCN